MFVAFYALILDLFAAPSDAQFYTLLEGPVSLWRGPGPTRGTGNSNTASDHFVIQLLKSKCIPVLLYSLEVCNLPKRDLQSLDFTVNRFFMKLFCTKDISVVTCCQKMFRVERALPSEIIKKRLVKFESKCDILFVS